MTTDAGCRAHYGEFYGPTSIGGVAFVHGNCQAEALRVVLAGSATFPWPTVRVPPVHELTRADLPPLRALLARTRTVITQPVRDGYRGLPVGTAQLAAQLPRGARVVRVPIVRHLGLHPYAAIVRHPADPSANPPVVAYHDLRTLTAAAGRTGPVPPPAPETVRAIGAASIAELRRREQRDCDVGVADLLTGFGADAAHTLNHPGNPVLVALARRVQTALGLPADAPDPGRTLLGEVRAPLERAVVDALNLDGTPRPHWLVRGRPVPDDEARRAQEACYRADPAWITAGLTRHADRIAQLGL